MPLPTSEAKSNTRILFALHSFSVVFCLSISHFIKGTTYRQEAKILIFLGKTMKLEESSRRSTLANRHQCTMAFRIYGDEQKGSMNKARCSLMVCKMILQYSSGERSCLAEKPWKQYEFFRMQKTRRAEGTFMKLSVLIYPAGSVLRGKFLFVSSLLKGSFLKS